MMHPNIVMGRTDRPASPDFGRGCSTSKQICGAFEDVVRSVNVPGVVFEWGYMGERFYFQPILSFSASSGLKVDALGRYSFPERYQVDDIAMIAGVLRDAVAQAFADLVSQTFNFAGHKPFALPVLS